MLTQKKPRSPLPDQPGNPLKPLKLRLKFFLGSLFYLTYAVQAHQYSRNRDRLERQFAPPPPPTTGERPGKLLQAESTQRGVQFFFEQAELNLCFLSDDLVRLTWEPGLLPVPYAIATSEAEWRSVTVTLAQTDAGWIVSTAALRVEVGIEGTVTLYDAAGTLLRQEEAPSWQGERCGHRVKLRPEEHIYGLGERAAPLNLRSLDSSRTPENRTYRMWNYDAAGMYGSGSDPMYLCIPLYLSLHQAGSYLAFYENSFDGYFTIQDSIDAQFEGGCLRYYLTIGSPADVLQRYTQLTGRSPLPPRWALGYHQSRWDYRTEAAVRDTALLFQKLDLPLSAIHLDIDVQVGFRAFTVDPDRFPKLGEFTQELMAFDVRFITIINPGIKHSTKSRLYLQGKMLDAFCKLPDGNLVLAPVWCGWSVFPDFTHPRVRQWWSRQYEFLLDLGVAGFWHDMNEPAAFISHGDRSLPKVTQHYMEGRGGDHREAHNVYGFLQARAGYESLCRYHPNQRPFIVSRAGWAGLQRYAWTWTGDVECTWNAMRQTIATLLGLGLSGIAYGGSDIGGFQGNPSAELYVRWFQMATFHPFFRSHCSNNVEYRAPWTYGEPYLSIIRTFLNLRYRLLPYFYSLAWETTQTGHPFCRPLFWNHPQDATLWDIDDEFLLGDALLVCPVFEEGGRSRQVTFPPGHWYSFWDDTAYAGMTTVELAAPLDTLPLLVKAGSLLPMQENDRQTLHLYAPSSNAAPVEAIVYSDAGDGYGEYRLDRFRLVSFSHGLELFHDVEGNYSPNSETITLYLHGFQLQHLWIDGTAQPINVELTTIVLPQLFHQAFLQGKFITSFCQPE